MSYKPNDNNQLSIDDSTYGLTDREQRFLEKSWAKSFADVVFPAINEDRFAKLYSEKTSIPNTPVNVILGALMLKELQGLTDDEVVEALLFDVRFQYALHTTSFQEQPLSDRTLSRFRERCIKYETQTGTDLIKECVIELAAQLSTVMGITSNVKRMDSMMIASNIKKMSRFELIYTCIANLIKYIHNNGEIIHRSMEHYIEKDDRNKMTYHMRSQEIGSRFTQVFEDVQYLLDKYEASYSQSNDYQLLNRVINEQAAKNADGKWELKEKSDATMNSQILQNPADPDATFRTKAGGQHQGYAANFTEDVGETGSIVSGYQYDTNTHSDSKFLQESIKEMDNTTPVTLVADGGYGGEKNHQLAAEHDINIVTTNFQGRKPKDILADFKFNEDGKKVIQCAGGQEPITNKYYPKTSQCRITLNRSICDRCPLKEQCKPKFHKTKTSLIVSSKGSFNAKQLRYMKTERFIHLAKIRNGVESLPSILRRKYNVDHMPVRGKLKTKLFFGFKVAALNFKKLFDYQNRLDTCVQFCK